MFDWRCRLRHTNGFIAGSLSQQLPFDRFQCWPVLQDEKRKADKEKKAAKAGGGTPSLVTKK